MSTNPKISLPFSSFPEFQDMAKDLNTFLAVRDWRMSIYFHSSILATAQVMQAAHLQAFCLHAEHCGGHGVILKHENFS